MSDEERTPAPEKPAPPPLAPVATRLEIARTAGQYGSVGMSFVLAIVIGVALGLWLDRITGLSPLFLVALFIAGFAAGVLNVYRVLSRPGK